jgi:hypothetical protein
MTGKQNRVIRRYRVQSLMMCRYYQGYLEFFTTAVRTSGVEATLEKYLMSDDANLTIDGKTEGGPLMLVRFVDALVHPVGAR